MCCLLGDVHVWSLLNVLTNTFHTSTSLHLMTVNVLGLMRGRESLVGQAAGRTTLPTPGAQSVRLTYHNIPVEIPPPPNARLMAKHSYTN